MTKAAIDKERRRLQRLLARAQTPQEQGKLIAELANPGANLAEGKEEG